MVIYFGGPFWAQVLTDDFFDGILKGKGNKTAPSASAGVHLPFDGHDGGQQPGYFLVSGTDAGVFE